MLLPGGGGALKGEGLNRVGEMRGDCTPLLLGGVPGPPPDFFFKSMYLRTHFKPF